MGNFSCVTQPPGSLQRFWGRLSCSRPQNAAGEGLRRVHGAEVGFGELRRAACCFSTERVAGL